MLIQIDVKELEAFAEKLKNIRLENSAWDILRQVSFALEGSIKGKTPVDKGRARASWGHGGWEPGDSIWIEDEGKLTITQGSGVVYYPALNAGHSTQAPAGFVEMEAGRAELVLAAALGNLDILDPQVRLALGLF